MSSALDIQIVSAPNLAKIENYLKDASYRETIEYSANFNTRLCIERRLRLPFLDPQTGVAQNHSHLFMDKKQRMPGFRQGQIYTYPATRWRKSRRQYLNKMYKFPDRPFQALRKDHEALVASTTGTGAAGTASPTVSTGLQQDPDLNSSLMEESSSLGAAGGDTSDSKDSQQQPQSLQQTVNQHHQLKEDLPKEWFYDDIDINDNDSLEEPKSPADDEYDYDPRYGTKKRRKRGRGKKATLTPGEGVGPGPGRRRSGAGRGRSSSNAIATATLADTSLSGLDSIDGSMAGSSTDVTATPTTTTTTGRRARGTGTRGRRRTKAGTSGKCDPPSPGNAEPPSFESAAAAVGVIDNLQPVVEDHSADLRNYRKYLGKFAAVRRAIHKNSGTHFAAKFLKRRRRAQSSDKEIKHEIAVLMLCNEADNIVKLNAVHESRSDTALLLELATGGELQTFLDNEECLTEAQARICMREVLKALQFLHKRSIVHLDLKPQNILLAGEHIEDGLKLCDFGISRVVAEGTNVREIVGTPDYVAPEVLQYEPLSLCTDIWSVGVLAYVLLSGFSPFGGETKQETFLNISQCALTFPDKLFGGVSSAAIDFIRRALRIKPNDRMTAAGCLEHIWLKDECNIDRHIFNAIQNKQQLEQDGDGNDHDDEEDDHDNDEDEDNVDVDDDDDDDEVDVDENHEQEVDAELQVNADDKIQLIKDKPQAISVDNSEEEDNILHNSFNKTTQNTLNKPANSHTNGHVNGHSATYKSGHTNGFANGYISGLSNGHTNGFLNGHSNGHISVLTKGHSATNFNKLHDDLQHEKSIKFLNAKQVNAATTTTTKTTAVHNVSATKAITIPLCSVQPTSSLQQQQQQTPQEQQLLHIPARRHSSESNKENTFLTTKKITASNCNGSTATLKKASSLSCPPSAVTQSSTATIHITPSATHNTSNIVATITLPPPTSNATNLTTDNNNKVSSVSNGNHHSLFPDAPTTPKVIRKTPSTDASPTSVKALVKKFQLEGGEQPITPPEFATNGSRTQYQQQQIQQTQQTHNLSQLKYNANVSRPSMSPPTLAHSSAITIANSARRASEPINAMHTNKKQNITSSSAPVSIPASAAQNYKTTCVYCVSCTNSSKNGCWHPNSFTSNISTSLTAAATAAVNTTTTAMKSSCSTMPLSSNCTKSLMNGSTSNGGGSLITSTSSNGSTSSSTTALLYGQHQQQQHSHSQHLLNSHQQHSHHSHHHPHHQHQHQHHHHHPLQHHHGVVMKSAATSANGLSLDQGIIC